MAQTTKRALAASFKELLAQKPFNKITISDITEHCGVNRMTFYYHFHDIYDLAQWAFEEETAELLNGSLSAASWKEGFVMVARQLEENQVLLANICRSVPRRELEQRMKGLVQRLLDPILKRELLIAAAVVGVLVFLALSLRRILRARGNRPRVLLRRLLTLRHFLDCFKRHVSSPRSQQFVI